MNIGRLFLTLFFTLSFIVCAFGQNFQEKIGEYLLINGTHTQYSNAYDQMFEMLERQFSNENVPSSLWEELKKNKEVEVNNVLTLLGAAYQKNFTETDISEMLAFYKSEAGRQLVVDANTLSENQRAEVSQFFGSEVGQKIASVQKELAADVSQVSEFWSRDLFKATTEKLSAKGYHLPH
ncbi:DUF2059 domain-containing protein [Rasiella rasia]|uniref:DUF2059 domain-containing protein n=1 Tax=Rasiella rasia TaxID=2744027 RepID=A0A6G6GKG1_9FLAO|nr:DUF2059 domain-containing protein [Rasiella rasia]QIE59065.1 DUF2059 domain-containing protein [Rasiella rasia]